MNQELIPISDQELITRLQEYGTDAEGAFAENTMMALRRDLEKFADWCQKQNRSPLPATDETVRNYVYWCSEKYKPASIERYLASIAHLHRAAEQEDPTKSNRVKLALKTVKRDKGTRQKQAKGMTLFDLARIEAVLEGTPREIRDYAMLRVARDAMLRSSNVVALDVEDFTFDDDGSGTVLIKRSKTDQEGRGAVKWISPDAVSAVKNWWRFAGIKSGAAFLTVTRGTSVKINRVAKRDFERGIKRLSLKAGVDPLSGHSPRVGMSQDLTAAGIDLIAIMQAGGWKSTKMPARYTEHLTVKRGAVAQFYIQTFRSRKKLGTESESVTSNTDSGTYT